MTGYPPVQPPPLHALRALLVLKRNIQSLLMARKESQVALAQHVRHSKAWINKFLTDPHDRVEIKISDIDRIASFFGIEPYQLFQPGISTLTERRVGNERRTGRDRRIGHAGRQLAGLRTELAKLPHPTEAAHAGVSASRTAAVPEPVQRILQAAERQIAAIYADLGRQTRATGTEGARVPRGRRKLRGAAANGAD